MEKTKVLIIGSGKTCRSATNDKYFSLFHIRNDFIDFLFHTAKVVKLSQKTKKGCRKKCRVCKNKKKYLYFGL